MAQEVHVGDVGLLIRLTVKQDGLAEDISAATTKEIKLRKPSGEVVTLTASFTTSGVDGQVQAVTTTTDLDEEGVYRAYVYLVRSSWLGHTTSVRFNVLAAGE